MNGRPSSDAVTVHPAKTTARPEVAMAAATASAGAEPRAQPLPVPGHHEQRVVDAHAKTDQRRQLRREGRHGHPVAEGGQLGRIGDDVDGLDEVAAHAEHQYAGQVPVAEPEQGRLPGQRLGDQCRPGPEPQQVPGHPGGDVRHLPHRAAGPKVDVPPRVRCQHRQQAVQITRWRRRR